MPRSVEVNVRDGEVVITERGDGTAYVDNRVGPGGLAGPLVDFQAPVRWAVADSLTANGVSIAGLFDSPCG